MIQNKMTLSEELAWRGLIYQTTFKDIIEIDKKKFIVYHGFDASANSQTIGNLASMMIDLCFLRHGHKTIVLAGGATSLVGDAGGRDSERLLQQEEIIRENVEAAKKQIQKIYGAFDFTLVNNIDWFKDMNMLTFLRDIGKSFNVGEMIKKDIVANRIGEGKAGISYTEFSYSLLQGYDFLHLFDNYNCTIQLCGADQWTNCIAGVELIRKKRDKEAHIITNPLIIDKKTGKKFGKSADGAVWLDAEKTSVFDFYQFWINTDDEGCKDYVKIYTEILPEEYENLITEASKNPSQRLVQKYLAYEVTKLVHSEAEAEKAKKQSEELFGQNEVNLENIGEDQTINLEGNFIVEDKLNLIEFLVAKNILKSKREAREFIESGAISINEEKINAGDFEIKKLGDKKEFLLRIGKKKYYKIVIV
jgi:tyrosyl-tRNA synthetase